MVEPIAEESTDSVPVATVPHRTFGHSAAKGFASTLASTLIVKGVSFAGQIVIAAHLSKHEMGLAATALAASTFPAQIKEFGILQLLLRHPRRYDEWSVDAASLSTVLGVLAAVATIVSVPLVARVTHSPGVVGPLLLLSLNNLIVGPTLVPFAKFSIDLRFILVARLNTALTIITTCVSIGLALRGFGPYALVLPLLLGSIIRSVTTFWLAPIRMTRWPAWSRWRVMLGDGWRMSLGLMFFHVVWQCDYLILGMRRSQEQVGIY